MGLAFPPVRPRVCSAKRTPPRFLSLADRPHNRLPGYASKRSRIGPSACLTIGPALCSAGRPIRSFCLGNNTHLFFSVLRPGVFSPFPTNLFRPSPPPCFFNRALSPCVLGFLRAGVIGGLCRRAALPVHTLPPADPSRSSALLFHPSALRPSVWSPSRPPVRMSTPSIFWVSSDNPARSFPPARRFSC